MMVIGEEHDTHHSCYLFKAGPEKLESMVV